MVTQALPSAGSNAPALAPTGTGAVQTGLGAVQAAQLVRGALQAGSAGLPQLVSAVLPTASSLLGAVSNAGKLPSLQTATPPKTSFKTPSLLAGEMLL